MERIDRIEQLPVSDWTDQDLLTKDEAKQRLVDEITVTRARLEKLTSANADDAEVTLLERRLNAMESIRDEYNAYLHG